LIGELPYVCSNVFANHSTEGGFMYQVDGPEDARRRVLVHNLKSSYKFAARGVVILLVLAVIQVAGFVYFLSKSDDGFTLFCALAALGLFGGALWLSSDRDKAARSLVAQGEDVPAQDEWLPTALVTSAIAAVASVVVAVIGRQ
jgi:hypothetical protein